MKASSLRLRRTTKRLRYPRRTNMKRFRIYRILISVMSRLCQIHNEKTGYYLRSPFMGLARDRPSGDRQSSTCCGKYRCPESESDFPVVTRTADFEGRGGIHTAEGGGEGVRSLSLRVYHVRYELYQNPFRMVFRKTGYEMAVITLGRRWIC